MHKKSIHMNPIVIKLSGEIFQSPTTTKQKKGNLSTPLLKQIKQIQRKRIVGIVIGGGNILRGKRDHQLRNIERQKADYIGMLGTIINGIYLKELCTQNNIPATLFTSFINFPVGETCNESNISKAMDKKHCLIFSGGTGLPYFSTDTTAVLRALQIKANTILKGTKVDGIYDKDPQKYQNAKLWNAARAVFLRR